MWTRVLAAGVAVVACAGTALGQTTVILPDTSQTTSVSATVSEQARVAVPPSITFNVTDIGSSTSAGAATVTVTQIVLASATKQLRLSLQANAAAFTPPEPGAVTWSAGDVTWNAASWTNATGAAGTLSNSSYGTVATCAANATGCSTSALIFTLAPKTSVQRAGTHSLTVTWKIESIGS